MTRYVLEGSSDGEKFEVLRDKSSAETNLPHDTLLIEKVDSFNENGITHGVVQKLRLDKVNEKIYNFCKHPM